MIRCMLRRDTTPRHSLLLNIALRLVWDYALSHISMQLVLQLGRHSVNKLLSLHACIMLLKSATHEPDTRQQWIFIFNSFSRRCARDYCCYYGKRIAEKKTFTLDQGMDCLASNTWLFSDSYPAAGKRKLLCGVQGNISDGYGFFWEVSWYGCTCTTDL